MNEKIYISSPEEEQVAKPAPEPNLNLASGLAALSNPSRLLIVQTLAKKPACCCKDIVDRLGLAQSTVSQHLKVLMDVGLVTYSPDRQRSLYSLDAVALSRLNAAFALLADDCVRQVNSNQGCPKIV